MQCVILFHPFLEFFTENRPYRRISPDSLESVIYQLGRLRPENPDGLSF